MSSSGELQPAPPLFKSKVWKDFEFKVFYDAQGVSNVVKEIIIRCHCFSELRYVLCIISWHLFRDIYRILRKCIVVALHDGDKLVTKELIKTKKVNYVKGFQSTIP